MAVKDDPPICKFCKVGHVFKRMEEIAFYQSSDKGYLHCRATIMMGVCDNCQARVFDQEADKIFDDAFQREYKSYGNRWRALLADCHTPAPTLRGVGCLAASGASATRGLVLV